MSGRNEVISDLLDELLRVLEESNSDIDSIIGDNQTEENSNPVYQLLNDWLTKHYYQKSDVKHFFNDVNKILIGYSKHSFHRELPFQNDEIFDSLVTGINFLGEELNHSTVTTHYLHDIFSSIGDIVIVINKKGNMLYLNSKAFSLLEFSESELKDKSIKTILEKNTSVTELMNVDSLNKSVNFISNTGKTIPTKITVSNFSRPDNPMMGYVIVARDMSFYYEYQKSKELFLNLFNDHSAVKLLIDAESLQIVNANRAAQAFYGASIEQLKMLKISDINALDNADGNDQFSELNDSQKINLQLKHRKFDGSICDVEVFPSTIVSEGKKIIHAIIHDISDRKKAEQSLLRRERELQSIFKGVPIGIGFEVNNEIIEVNQRITELLGYSKIEMIGKDISNFYSSIEEFDFVKCNVYPQAIKTGVASGETQWKRKDDVLLDIIFSISPMQIDDPQQGFIFSLLDVSENKKIQNKLFENEQKYRRIAENMSDVVWLCDLNFNITYISPSIEQLIGDSPEKYALRTPSEKFPPQTLETLQNILKEELQLDHYPSSDKNRNRITEIEHYKADGSIIWVELSMTFLRDGKGVPIGIQGTTRDIEKRKQIEIELEKSNRVFVHSLDMLCIATFDGYFKTLNPAWEKILGWSNEELLSKPWIDFVHPDDIESTKNIKLTKLDNGEALFSFENRFICKDGSVKWLSWNSFPYIQENILFGVARDITLRKEEEEENRKREQTLQKIFEIIPIGLWLADRNGKLIHGNPAGIKIWGAKPSVDPSEYDVFKARRLPSKEEIRPDDWALYHTITKGETIKDEILEIEAFDGKRRTILNYTAPILDDKNNITAAIVVNQDITEIKEYEQLLKKSVENWNQTFNAIQDAIALIDENQNIIQTNKAFSELVGDFPEKYIGCHCHSYVHGSTLPHNDCPFIKMLHSKKREVQEMMINNKICSVLVDPLIDEHNKIIGAVHIISDITEQKMNEIKLSDIYTRQRIISESIVQLNDIDDIDDIFRTLGNIVYENIANSYIVCVKDRPDLKDLNIVYQHGGNDFVEQITDIIGFPLQNCSIRLNEYSKKHITALKSGKLLRMTSGLKALVEKNYPVHKINAIESLLNIKSVYAIGISLHNRLFGGMGILTENHKLDVQVIDLIESLIQNATTIIQTKWLSNELKLSEKRYKTFFDSSSSMVYLKDSNLNYVLVNKSIIQFFGKTENQILGQNDFKLLPKKAAEVCVMNDKKALQANNVIVSIEKIGNQILQSTKFKVMLSSGEVGVGGYINDVTKEKQDERDLMLMNSLNESINKGLTLEMIVLNLKKFIYEEFDVHHVDVLYVSDDGMNLTWKKDQISKMKILQIEKILGSEINNELNISIHPENWYGRIFQNNQPHFTTSEEEIKEIIKIWMKSNIQFIPENLNFSDIISSFKIFTSMLTIPMVFNEKMIGLFHVTFKSKIETYTADRLKRLSDQLMILMDRKKSEQILHQTQLLLRETQAVAHLGGWSYHVENHLFSLTDEFYEIVGKDARKNLKNFTDLMQYFSSEDSHILNNAFLRLIKSGKPLDYEMQLLQKSDDKIWIRIIGKPVILDGKVNRIVGYFMNVDDRKKAEFYLKESEDKYRTLVEISTDAIFVNQDDKFVYLNKAASDLFGAKNVNELIGHSIYEFLHPDFHPKIIEKIEKMLFTSKPFSLIEERIIRNDGTIIDVEIVATPFSYRGKPAIQFILREITERRNLQRAILNAVIRSEENERDRIAKDLHDGIGPLLSTAKLVLQTHLATTKTNSKLEEHSLSLIDEAITGISEISHNISPHVLNNYGLSRAIETFVNKLRKVVPQKIKFKSNVPNRLESITEITLYRITLELINNCIKHTQAKDIRIELLQNNNIIILKVLHDGSGFDFENALNKGKGMGLINIKNRVNSLDGKLIWDNRKQLGMLVQIEIPQNN
jgi:PAS domain S-box-containing protein